MVSRLSVYDLTKSSPTKADELFHRWAWQNTHLTRRIAEEQRITVRETRIRVSPKSGRTRRRPAKPRISLIDKLSNLHLLLRVPSFARWPLEVRFFSEDVYRVWQRWSERVDGDIRDGITVVLDVKHTAEVGTASAIPRSGEGREGEVDTGGVNGVDVGYARIKSHVEKSLFLLAEGEVVKCAVCTDDLGTQAAMALVCSHEGCRSASHMTCLSRIFLEQDGSGTSLVPTVGLCPSCRTPLSWSDLVMEMSLRIRGEKEVARLMKKPRMSKAKATKGAKVLSSELGDENEEMDEAHDVADDHSFEDDWQYQELYDEDFMSVASAVSEPLLESEDMIPSVAQTFDSRVEVVIEDSDWDDAEVLD